MRNSILFLFISILVISCSSEPDTRALTKDEVVKVRAEMKLMTMMDDPSSYEFISIELVDSTSQEYTVINAKEVWQRLLDAVQGNLDIYILDKELYPSLYDQKKVDAQRADVNKYTKIVNGIDSIGKNLGESIKDATSYVYLFKFRAKNAFNALVLNQYYLQIDTMLEVIDLVDDIKDVNLSPVNLPGYGEVVAKYKGTSVD